MSRLGRLILVLLPIVGMFTAASSAQADPFFPDPHTSVVVTRLTIADGRGWLVLQPRIGHDTAIGFEGTIPAGNGAWSGPAAVGVPDLGISCTRKAGPALDYLCGSDDAWTQPLPAVLPSGGYQLSIPVTRTGSVVGLVGSTSFWELNPYEGAASYPADTFPVVPATHFLSTAEVRNFYTSTKETLFGADVGYLAVTMTVVPGEQVHALDLQLPPGDWRLLDYDFHPRIHCRGVAAAAGPVIRCASLRDTVNFAAGRYPFVFRLALPAAEDFSVGQPGSIALTVDGQPPAIQDTFGWYSTIYY